MAAPDLSLILAEALPEMRRLQRKVWYWLVGLCLGGFTLSHMLTDGFTRFHAGVFAVFVLVMAFVGSTNFWLRARKEMVLLPAVASAFGLTHQKRDEAFFTELPSQLLPRRGLRYTTDDSFTGEIAGQSFRFAEVIRAARKPGDDKTKSGVPDFRGLMVEITLKGEVKPLMIADKHQVQGSATSAPVLDPGTEPLRASFSHKGAEYGLWASSDERPRSRSDLLEGLVRLAPEAFDQKAFLYSAAVRGGKLTVALTYRHNLFTLGGLFSTRARLMQDIRLASDELAMVMRFITGALKLGQGIMASHNL